MPSRPPLRGKRDGNEAAIISMLRAIGCTVEVMNDAPFDLVAGIAGLNLLFEIKRTRRSKHTERQEQFRETWKGTVRTITTPEEAMAWVEYEKERMS